MKSLLRFLFILFLFSPLLVNAQENNNDGYSVNLRVGTVRPFNYLGGLHFSPELCFYRDQKIYSAEYSFIQDFVIFGEEDYILNKISFCYGKYWGQNWYQYQVQAGVGPLWGKRMISEQYFSFFTPGAFLKAGIKLIPFKFAAIAADVQLNLNMEVPNAMVMVGIDLGKLVNQK